MTHHLIGLNELAELLAVSRQRADQLARTAGFPAPTADLVGGRIWERAEIELWAAHQGRPMRAQTTREELAELTITGPQPARGAFISAFTNIKNAALGLGKYAGEVAPTRKAILEAAVAIVKAEFPSFEVQVPPGWLDQVAHYRGIADFLAACARSVEPGTPLTIRPNDTSHAGLAIYVGDDKLATVALSPEDGDSRAALREALPKLYRR